MKLSPSATKLSQRAEPTLRCDSVDDVLPGDFRTCADAETTVALGTATCANVRSARVSNATELSRIPVRFAGFGHAAGVFRCRAELFRRRGRKGVAIVRNTDTGERQLLLSFGGSRSNEGARNVAIDAGDSSMCVREDTASSALSRHRGQLSWGTASCSIASFPACLHSGPAWTPRGTRTVPNTWGNRDVSAESGARAGASGLRRALPGRRPGRTTPRRCADARLARR